VQELGYTTLYDQRVQPRPHPPFTDKSGIQRFFGCLPEDATTKLVDEYDMFLHQYGSLKADGTTDESPRVFWSDKTRCEAYPTMSKLARWYSNMPTSSVAAERAFALMRSFDIGIRRSMKEGAFRANLEFRVNGWIVDDLLKESFPPKKGGGSGSV
jgi:hAT family C-terminal dimerisation region